MKYEKEMSDVLTKNNDETVLIRFLYIVILYARNTKRDFTQYRIGRTEEVIKLEKKRKRKQNKTHIPLHPPPKKKKKHKI